MPYVTYLFIRHGPKEYRNGRALSGNPQHDSPIMRSCIPRCREVGQFLVNKYGTPNMVVMSPYLRTRQTAQELTYCLKYKKDELKNLFYIDNNIAEFLGNQRGTMDVTEETLNYSNNRFAEGTNLPSTQETMDSLINRIENHLLMMQILRSAPSLEEPEEDATSTPTPLEQVSKVVWIVTHGIVISKIYEVLKEHDFQGCNLGKFYPDELQGLSVEIDDSSEVVSFVYPDSPVIRLSPILRCSYKSLRDIGVPSTESGSDSQNSRGSVSSHDSVT